VDNVSQSRMMDQLVTLVGAGLRARATYSDTDLHRLVAACRKVGQPVACGVRVTRPVQVGRLAGAITEFMPVSTVTRMAYELAAAHGAIAGPISVCQTECTGTYDKSLGPVVRKHVHPVVLVMSNDPEHAGLYVFRVGLDCAEGSDQARSRQMIPCLVFDVYPCHECATPSVADLKMLSHVNDRCFRTPAPDTVVYADPQPPPLVLGGHRVFVPLDHAHANDATTGIVAAYLASM
jgi:hypothetical protein